MYFCPFQKNSELVHQRFQKDSDDVWPHFDGNNVLKKRTDILMSHDCSLSNHSALLTEELCILSY